MAEPSKTEVDVVIIGAGAAGLMCAHTAGYRGRSVLVIDHANKAGKKILMSGGGRCNFTNLNSTPANFLSNNPHFCISALKRYRPEHFVELVERHGVGYCEKAPGQLFCDTSSKDILQILLTECEWAGVEIQLNASVEKVHKNEEGKWQLSTAMGTVQCESLVIATGGLSIPTLGATGFGYDIAKQFGLTVLPVRAGLVPFTLQPKDKDWLAPLSGLSFDAVVSVAGGSVAGKSSQQFAEPVLITHRGASGPAMLQISSFWHPGDALEINILPQVKNLLAELKQLRADKPNSQLVSFLSQHLPKRFAQALCEQYGWQQPLQQFSNADLEHVEKLLTQWKLKPAGTEGYRTAEVTLGGVDTKQISSQTFEVNSVPGLYMIGEVLDVTGHLGGHNFQWAWASGFCAGAVV